MPIAQRYKDTLQQSPIILGTRGSVLALWQANHIKAILESQGISVILKSIKTKGDKILDAPLAKIGGKGLFTKELEQELLNRTIDFAVHSLKDVPVIIDPQLMLVAITKRADPRDCFVSEKYADIHALPRNAKVGTTSLRRSMQIKRIRNDVDTHNLRGNIQTRLEKLKNGDYDAIILASAAINRLGLQNEISHYHFDTTTIVPAMGQGALGLECRDPKYSSDFRDQAISKILESLHHKDTGLCCNIERAFIRLLGGGCQSPIGIHTKIIQDRNLQIEYIVGNLDATKILYGTQTCLIGEIEYVLQDIINSLKNQDVDNILNEVREKLG